jgi:GntR family transcriptional regulator
MGQPNDGRINLEHIIRASYKPLYLQISDHIRADIESGKLVPGDRIMSERELMEGFEVSRNTAQQAINELERNGLVSRIQGKGTFVTEHKVSYGLQRLSSFTEEMLRKGVTPSAKVLSIRREHPTPILCNRLKLRAEDWVYRLERLRLGDGQPMAYQVSYVPLYLVQGLEQFDFSSQSLFDVMEQNYNLCLSWQEQVISPVIARSEEAELLSIPVGMPLLMADGVAYLEDDTPAESKRILYRSDLYEFTVRSLRK